MSLLNELQSMSFKESDNTNELTIKQIVQIARISDKFVKLTNMLNASLDDDVVYNKIKKELEGLYTQMIDIKSQNEYIQHYYW